MDNYIVINGKKAELTEKQLKKLGIKVKKKGDEKKRNNPFNNGLKDMDFYVVGATSVFEQYYNPNSIYDEIKLANSFNDKTFANQVYLHQLLNRKLLKYAWDNNAEDCEWNEAGVNSHYFIYFDITKGHFAVGDNHYCHSQNIYFSKQEVAKQTIKDIIEPFMTKHPNFKW